MPALSDDVLYLPITELSRRIRLKRLSPVQLTESYLERSRKIGARLNAYATLTPELALKQAYAAEKEIAAGKYRGPLHGIPYAAKDLLAVKGYPTTWGAAGFEKQTFDEDRNDRTGGRTGLSICFGVCERRGEESME